MQVGPDAVQRVGGHGYVKEPAGSRCWQGEPMTKTKRTDLIIEVFKDAFDPLMKAAPRAFRNK